MERIYKCSNMHWEKTAAMWADGQISSLQKSSVMSDKDVCFPQTSSLSTMKH